VVVDELLFALIHRRVVASFDHNVEEMVHDRAMFGKVAVTRNEHDTPRFWSVLEGSELGPDTIGHDFTSVVPSHERLRYAPIGP
jgi:hypothetical protein